MKNKRVHILIVFLLFCAVLVPSSVVTATEEEILDGEYNGLTYMYNSEKVVITGYTGTDGDVTIPEEINGIPVTDIAEDAFLANSIIRSVTIEAEISNIPRGCFRGSSLVEVNMPDTIMSIEFQGFDACMNLTTIRFSENLKEIKDQAFLSCKSIKTIVLPDSVTKVEGDAFSNCTSLESITMPANLEDEVFMFDSCTSLKNIILPDTVTCSGTFRDCHSLSSIVLPDGITKINSGAFLNCYCLTEIYIPENVTDIGENAFDGCNFLTVYGESGSYAETYAKNNSINFSTGEMQGTTASCLSNDQFTYIIYEDSCMISKYNGSESDLIIPTNIDGVKITHIAPRMFEWGSIQNLIIEAEIESLPNYCFFGSSIKTIELPNTLKKIEDNCFNGCRSLKEVELPEGVTTLEHNCFQDCSDLESIVIPSTVASIARSVFGGCEGLKTVVLEDGIMSVSQCMFSGCKTLEVVTLPSSIESIGLGAFQLCSSLEQIVIPNKVTMIPANAFEGCSRLKRLELPEGVVSIGDQSFSGCTSLAGIYIPNATVTISSSAFEMCDLLTVCGSAGSYAETYANTVNIPFSVEDVSLYSSEEVIMDGVEYICGYDKACVYGGTSNSSNVIIQKEVNGKDVITIKDKAFCNDDTIENLDIQAEVEEIPWQCFGLCSNLKNVKLSTTVKTIKSSAFGDCPKLESVSLPNGMVAIEQFAFEDCSELKNIKLPEQLQSLDNGVFKDCVSLESIDIPKNISVLDTNLFYGCKNLTQVDLPQGLQKIEKEALYGCERLTQIYIPESVDSIAIDSFKNCYFLVISAPTDSYAIEYAKANGIKYVEIGYEEDGEGFNGEVNSDILDGMGDDQELPIVSENGSAIFDPDATIEICHRHGKKGVKFHYKVKKRHEIDNEKHHDAMHDAHKSGGRMMDFDLVNGDGEKIIFNTDENDGSVTITIPYEAPVSANEVKVYYIDSEGNKKDMNGVYDPSKKTITFVTTHFSTFSIETDVNLCESGHDYETEGQVVAPTCEDVGYTEYECIRCGETCQDNETEVLNHDWDEGKVTTEPTYTQAGVKTFTCLREGCGETKTEEIPALEEEENIGVVPPEKMEVEYMVEKVAEVSLVDYPGWEWNADSLELELTVGVEVQATAVYTGEEPEKYTTTEQTVTILRKECQHPEANREIRNQVDATSEQEGYTGDVYCKDCEQLVTEGEGLEKLQSTNKGDIVHDGMKTAKYRVVSEGSTVAYVGPYDKKAKNIIIPATIQVNGKTYKVTSIEKNAFKNNSKLTSVTIGSNVKQIGNNAFYKCKKLKKVTIGKNVTTIGEKSFYKCEALTKMTIPSKVTKIGKYAFYGCKKLKTITIKSTKLKSVGKNAIKGINKKATIKVPKKQLKKYKKLFGTKTGYKKTMKIKEN